jgi:hypothetical protein
VIVLCWAATSVARRAAARWVTAAITRARAGRPALRRARRRRRRGAARSSVPGQRGDLFLQRLVGRVALLAGSGGGSRRAGQALVALGGADLPLRFAGQAARHAVALLPGFRAVRVERVHVAQHALVDRARLVQVLLVGGEELCVRGLRDAAVRSIARDLVLPRLVQAAGGVAALHARGLAQLDPGAADPQGGLSSVSTHLPSAGCTAGTGWATAIGDGLIALIGLNSSARAERQPRARREDAVHERLQSVDIGQFCPPPPLPRRTRRASVESALVGGGGGCAVCVRRSARGRPSPSTPALRCRRGLRLALLVPCNSRSAPPSPSCWRRPALPSTRDLPRPWREEPRP